MITATGVRIGWLDLPAHVRSALEAVLGAAGRVGGFPARRVLPRHRRPGPYSRRPAGVRQGGQPGAEPGQPRLHRAEARHTAGLPRPRRRPGCSAATTTASGWRSCSPTSTAGTPHTPWRDHRPRPGAGVRWIQPARPLRRTRCRVRADRRRAAGPRLRRLAADRRLPPPRLDPWVAAHLAELCAAADRGLACLTGDTLCHLDVRADNLLIGPDGAVTVVDWPWACRGPAWLDTAMLLVNVRLHGGHAERVLTDLAARTGADPRDFTDVLAGAAGDFLDAARRPAPAGLPTLREFQRAQGEALLPWLRERRATGSGS